eukprot:266110-Rhodomonas_salina.4
MAMEDESQNQDARNVPGMEIGDGPYQVKVEGQETRKGRSGDDLRKGESRKGKSELLCGGRRGTRERGGLPLWLTTVVPGTIREQDMLASRKSETFVLRDFQGYKIETLPYNTVKFAGVPTTTC